MDLELSETELAFRDEARAWLAANVPAEPLPSMDTAEGWALHQEWEARLTADRWSVVSWPRDYHGREASLAEWVIFEEEYYRAGAPARVSQNGIFLLAPIIFEHGTKEQQDRFLPTMASGEQIWAQCWSEPEAGSDLASLKSTARRVSTSSTTGGAGGCSTVRRPGRRGRRTPTGGSACSGPTPRPLDTTASPTSCSPSTPRASRSGRSPSSTVRPASPRCSSTRCSCPTADVLGAPGDGWRVAMSTAGNERGLSLRSPGRFCAAADRLVELYRESLGFEARKLAPQPAAVGDRVVDAWIQAEAYRLYTWGTVTRLADGGEMGAAGSVNKVWWSELDIALHETALDLLGPEAEVDSTWLDGYTFALSGPIYAGTNEIQRNIIAERLLGLPREPKGAGR